MVSFKICYTGVILILLNDIKLTVKTATWTSTHEGSLLLVKFLKLTVLNLTNLRRWEEGSMVEIII